MRPKHLANQTDREPPGGGQSGCKRTQFKHRAISRHLHKTAGLQRHPDKTTSVDGPRRQTFSQLAVRVSRLVGTLVELGIARVDRVAVLAVWWMGAVLNPVNTLWTANEVAYALKDCGARAVR